MSLTRLILVTLLFVSPVVAQSNADYARGREAEAAGNIAGATANYQAVVSRESPLKEYALWRLARLARATGDLPLGASNSAAHQQCGLARQCDVF